MNTPNEQHIMELAAISTASIQNTVTSIRDRIGKENPYWTVAYGDVCTAIDREIAQRARADKFEEALRKIRNFPVHSEPMGGAYAMQDIADEALNTDLEMGREPVLKTDNLIRV